MLWGSSTLSKFHTSFSKVCVKVRQRYLSNFNMIDGLIDKMIKSEYKVHKSILLPFTTHISLINIIQLSFVI